MAGGSAGWMSTGRDGARTAAVAAVGVILAASISSLAALRVGDARAIGLYGDALVDALAAATIFYAARQIADRLVRTTWYFIGASVALTAIGEAVWGYAHIELGIAEMSFSIGDAFYLTAYLIMAIGLVRYAFSFRSRVDFAWIGTETVVTTAALGATLWVVFLAPTTRGMVTLSLVTLADLTYVFLDFPLLLAPILVLLLVMVRLRDHELASPWGVVALGIMMTITADVIWFWERSHGGWQPGSLADFGFMTANVMFAVGAMATVDAQHRIERRREAARD
jgi:hypothetical protein